METSTKSNKTHIGRKIGRLREIKGIKQDLLAFELGVSQQAISKIEQSEDVDDATLEKIAGVLGLSVEAIKNFDEETVLNIINNTFTSNDTSTSIAIHTAPTFNPLDKLVEAYEENKKLYERLLDSEKEKVEILKNSK